MEPFPLDVKGWMTGLNLVMGVVFALIGLWGLGSGCLLLGQGHSLGEAGVRLVIGLAIPLGIAMIRKALAAIREGQNA